MATNAENIAAFQAAKVANSRLRVVGNDFIIDECRVEDCDATSAYVACNIRSRENRDRRRIHIAHVVSTTVL